MAEDKERDAQKIAKAAELGLMAKRPATSAVKRLSTQGAVKRPLTPRIGRGF